MKLDGISSASQLVFINKIFYRADAVIKQVAISLLSMGPLPALLQRLRAANTVTILAYHCVIEKPLAFEDWCFLDKVEFEKQIKYLTSHFDVIPMSEAVNKLKTGSVDRPTAVITFDDGFQNNFTQAYPILQKYQAPATIYLVSSLIGSAQTVWFTRLIRGLSQTHIPELEWKGVAYPLKSPVQKKECSYALQALLKNFPADQLEAQLDQILKRLKVELNSDVEEGSPFRMLSNNEIEQMCDAGLIEFGAHTVNHTILSRLDSESQAEQIRKSIDAVGQMSRQSCNHFAYPNGGANDFNDASLSHLANHNVQSAVTMIPGSNDHQTPHLELHRYGIGSDTQFSRFKLMVHHIR